jgi:hypothetical protein
MSDSTFAVPEMAAVQVKGMTREAFLMRGTLAAVAVGGLGAVGPFLSDAIAAGSPAGDLAILNYALTLEYLESDFYNVKAKTVGLTGAAKTLVKLIAGHEAAHVTGLTSAIKAAGGTPATKPTFVFNVSNQTEFLALASVLENTGVAAYNGQGPKLQNKAYLGTAGSIVQIEARHAAAINYMIGKSPTPDEGFDKPLEMAAVLKAVKPLIKA